jgi:hypothetical protein
MSFTSNDNLKTLVMESKILVDDVRRSLENLKMRVAELLSSRKIDFQTAMKLDDITLRMYNLIEDGKLKEVLDQMVSVSNVLAVAPYFALDENIRSHNRTDLLEVIHDLGFTVNTLFEKPLPAVVVGTERDPEQRTKSIDNILYSYTPYKLRGTSGNHTILLLPSSRGPSLNTKWCDDDARTTFEGSTKILTPNSIKLTNVEELNSIVAIDGEQGFRLEIDRRSPKETYYCRMGVFVSPTSACNRRSCYLWDVCQGKKFWKGPKTLYSLAKVSPNMAVTIDTHDPPATLQTNKMGLAVETVENLQAKVYIDSVIFYSSYMNHNPMIKLKEAPGYKIATKGIAFSLDSAWVDRFVETVLANDQAVFAWVFTKYFLRANYDVNDLRRITAFFANIIKDKQDAKTKEFSKLIKQHEVDPTLVKFGVRLLIHSLAHLVHQEIVSMLQTSSKNLVYSFGEKTEADGKYRIFIIENAERGLGLTESFASLVGRQSNYLGELAERISKMLALCARTGLGFQPPTQASPDVKMIWDHVNQYNRTFQLKFGISVPVEFVRYILSQYDFATSKVIERDDIAPYIDDILSTTPLCWDGCYHCVRLEMDCHDSPYEQVFDVSKSLLTSFLNEWNGTFEKPIADGKGGTVVQIGEAKKLLTYIKAARERIFIISPWFSKEVARTLCSLAVDKNLRITILTSDDRNNETHAEALRIFGAAEGPNLSAKILTDRLPHIKMTIIDDSLLIVGSANLTLSGLYENIEGYVIIEDPETVGKAVMKYHELWTQGTEIKRT